MDVHKGAFEDQRMGQLAAAAGFRVEARHLIRSKTNCWMGWGLTPAPGLARAGPLPRSHGAGVSASPASADHETAQSGGAANHSRIGVPLLAVKCSPCPAPTSSAT